MLGWIHSAETRGESRHKFPGPGGPERGPTMLHMILSFSLVSGLMREWYVLMRALAVSGHLAYDALCFVSLLLPLSMRPWWGPNPPSTYLWINQRDWYAKECSMYVHIILLINFNVILLGDMEAFVWLRKATECNMHWHRKWSQNLVEKKFMVRGQMGDTGISYWVLRYW